MYNQRDLVNLLKLRIVDLFFKESKLTLGVITISEV